MTRRELLMSAAAAAAPAFAAPRTRMGIATTSLMTARRPHDTYEFLEYCNGLGAGGIQASLSSLEPDYLKKLRARPVVSGEKMPLAIENHKDWTAQELAALMKDKSSEYLGVCLDTGNNIALLDNPMETIETLAPYALSTHFKDMAVELYADGFLLSEVPLGEGIVDLKRAVAAVHNARPKTRFTLEMITRNPLEV